MDSLRIFWHGELLFKYRLHKGTRKEEVNISSFMFCEQLQFNSVWCAEFTLNEEMSRFLKKAIVINALLDQFFLVRIGFVLPFASLWIIHHS